MLSDASMVQFDTGATFSHIPANDYKRVIDLFNVFDYGCEEKLLADGEDAVVCPCVP
jgi:hypothetical protein